VGALDPKNRRNLFLRVASAGVLFPIAVWLVIVGDLPFALLAAFAGVVAAAELVLMFARPGVGEVVGIAVAGVIPFMAAFGASRDLLPGWSGLFIACATVLVLAIFLFRRGPLEEVPRSISVVALSWLYCGLLLATLVKLRGFGVAWVILAFVVTWGNDTFAYFAGHAFGRHKLYERISPKKTWEGFAGGAAASLVAGVLLSTLMLGNTWWFGLIFGAAIFLSATLGDLVESLIKRDIGIKDMSSWLPGHGGFLDRLDSILPSAAVAYVAFRIFG
jgi:phosphatidate cytidylyltransferase